MHRPLAELLKVSQLSYHDKHDHLKKFISLEAKINVSLKTLGLCDLISFEKAYHTISTVLLLVHFRTKHTV